MQSPILTLCAVLVVSAAQASPSASVVDLGPTSLFSTQAPENFFPGGSGVLNGHGHVAGVAYDPVLGPVAAIDVFGTVTALGSTAILESYGTAINDAESVVGYFSSAVDATHAGLFRRGRPTVDLGSLGGPISAAFAINNNGVIVGYSYLADGSTAHAASFSALKGPVDLGALGGSLSAALAVNRFNRAVGFSLLSDNATFHATLFSSYAPAFDLGSLGGPLSVATAINGRGEIVGASLLSDGVTTHAAAFTPGGAPTDLGALAGDTTSLASGINSAGCIVGTSSSLVQRGVLWTKSRGVWTILDLNSLITATGGWTIDSAIAINREAIVVATGFKSDGIEHTVLINLGNSLESRCIASDDDD
jgi:probable HAF family extracellular repeat protein